MGRGVRSWLSPWKARCISSTVCHKDYWIHHCDALCMHHNDDKSKLDYYRIIWTTIEQGVCCYFRGCALAWLCLDLLHITPLLRFRGLNFKYSGIVLYYQIHWDCCMCNVAATTIWLTNSELARSFNCIPWLLLSIDNGMLRNFQ